MTKLLLLIDDDLLVNLINRKFIERVLPSSEIRSFVSAYEALDFLHNLKNLQSLEPVIFLDINMPLMNGWDFLDEIRKEFNSRDFEIFVLSSSVDPEDMRRAESYPLVRSFISKPLSVEKIKSLGF